MIERRRIGGIEVIEIDEEALKIIRKIIDQNERIIDLLLSPMVEVSGGEQGDPFKVDWSKAPVWARYHTFNSDGYGHWFSRMPFTCAREWNVLFSHGDVRLSGFSIAGDGEVDWTESLRERPDHATCAPMPPEIFDVDWSGAPDWANYHAFDNNGYGYWFSKEPFIHTGKWRIGAGTLHVSGIAILCPEEMNWTESLRKRPV